MARVVLGDLTPGDPTASTPMLVLDGEDLCGCTDTDDSDDTVVEVLTAEVRQRTRAGYDDDGVPIFEWASIQAGPVVSAETRDEFDAEAGMVHVEAVITMLVAEQIDETSVIVFSDGRRFRVGKVQQSGGTAVVTARMIDQVPTGEAGS